LVDTRIRWSDASRSMRATSSRDEASRSLGCLHPFTTVDSPLGSARDPGEISEPDTSGRLLASRSSTSGVLVLAVSKR